jgi:hypothetical protein
MKFRSQSNEMGLDEVVMENCFIHLERMDDTCFWIGIENPIDGLHHIQVYVKNNKIYARIEKQ